VDLGDFPIIFNARETSFREIAGLGIAMRRGDTYEFEGGALDLFREIHKGSKTVTRKSLAHQLSAKYNIPYCDAWTDTLDFTQQLLDTQLIHDRAQSQYVATSALGAIRTTQQLKCWDIARTRKIPLKCKFDLTYRCNIACKFCYNGERPGLPGPYPTRTELTSSEIAEVLRQLRDAGTFFLTLSGGEPLARRDIEEILAVSDDLDFAVEILTNGTLVSDALAKKMATHRVQLVVVPLFGAEADTHDAFVRQAGAFKRACRGISALRKEGVEVGVRCAITRANFSEWQSVRDLVAELGARYFPHAQIHLSSDRQVDLRDLRLTNQQLEELFDGGMSINPDYSCEVGYARVDVLPNGDVALCSLLTEPMGNLRDQTFAQIWEGSARLGELRNLLGTRVSGCNGCSVAADARYRCSADALFDDGGLDRLSSEALRVLAIADRPSQV